MRYIVIDESVSWHCCFAATVVDTAHASPDHQCFSSDYLVVCECFTVEDARMIADLLNDLED